MARLNTPVRSNPVHTHEGAKASRVNPNEQLRRSVLSCLLWENTFYESGESIADRISNTADKCSPEFVSALAKEARNQYRLRHAPLWLCMSLIRRGGKLAGQTLTDVIQRPDEITEALSMYWKDGKRPLSKQLKIGLANAFNKFDEYQLAKYNRDSAIKLRDALFMVHAKPKDDAQGEIFKRLVNNELAIPETWEVKLSGGQNKAEAFTDLLKRNKLGYMALLRNLRNMHEAGVDRALVKKKILAGASKSKALPFRFLSAAKAAPSFEAELDLAMQQSVSEMPKLPGTTVLLVDVSTSMSWSGVSEKSDLTRIDAAAALAALAREVCEDCFIYMFATGMTEAPARRGMALIDAIKKNVGGGTNMGGAVAYINQNVKHDRLIVVTDEQSRTPVPNPVAKGYILNVATFENGVGYGPFTHINGWSEQSIRYIQETEGSD